MIWIQCENCGYEVSADFHDCSCENCDGYCWSEPYWDGYRIEKEELKDAKTD